MRESFDSIPPDDPMRDSETDELWNPDNNKPEYIDDRIGEIESVLRREIAIGKADLLEDGWTEGDRLGLELIQKALRAAWEALPPYSSVKAANRIKKWNL